VIVWLVNWVCYSALDALEGGGRRARMAA
jgi:hypothetical protein